MHCLFATYSWNSVHAWYIRHDQTTSGGEHGGANNDVSSSLWCFIDHVRMQRQHQRQRQRGSHPADGTRCVTKHIINTAVKHVVCISRGSRSTTSSKIGCTTQGLLSVIRASESGGIARLAMKECVFVLFTDNTLFGHCTSYTTRYIEGNRAAQLQQSLPITHTHHENRGQNHMDGRAARRQFTTPSCTQTIEASCSDAGAIIHLLHIMQSVRSRTPLFVFH